MRHVNRSILVGEHGPELFYVTDSDGRTWPIPAGGSDDTPPPSSDDDVDPPGDTPPAGDPDALGDPGKRALDAERNARKEAEKRAKAAEQALTEAQKAQMDDHERAIAEAREEAASERDSVWMPRMATTEAKALAANTADPEAVIALLKERNDGTLNNFVADGDVNTDAMSAAIEEILEAKPYLKPAAATAVGGADQGRRPPPAPTRASSLEEAVTAHYSTD